MLLVSQRDSESFCVYVRGSHAVHRPTLACCITPGPQAGSNRPTYSGVPPTAPSTSGNAHPKSNPASPVQPVYANTWNPGKATLRPTFTCNQLKSRKADLQGQVSNEVLLSEVSRRMSFLNTMSDAIKKEYEELVAFQNELSQRGADSDPEFTTSYMFK